MTVLSGFSPAFSVKGAMLPYRGVSHLPQVVSLQVYILLKTCFCESLVLPRRVISLYCYHERRLCGATSTGPCPLMQAQHIWTHVTPLLLKGIPS